MCTANLDILLVDRFSNLDNFHKDFGLDSKDIFPQNVLFDQNQYRIGPDRKMKITTIVIIIMMLNE